MPSPARGGFYAEQSRCRRTTWRAFRAASARDALARLNRLIGNKPFHVELGGVHSLAQDATAHRQIDKHHLGKLAFEMRPS